jgi:hypothetical protein
MRKTFPWLRELTRFSFFLDRGCEIPRRQEPDRSALRTLCIYSFFASLHFVAWSSTVLYWHGTMKNSNDTGIEGTNPQYSRSSKTTSMMTSMSDVPNPRTHASTTPQRRGVTRVSLLTGPRTVITGSPLTESEDSEGKASSCFEIKRDFNRSFFDDSCSTTSLESLSDP